MKSSRFSSKAIVIHRENFGEADQYVEFLTHDWGLITAMARSARKSRRRYAGGLDIFCHDEIFLRGNPRETPYLEELTVLNSFLKLRDHLERLIVAGKIVHWIRKLPEPGHRAPWVYRLLGQTLSLLEQEEGPARMELLALVFKLKLLTVLGLKPNTDSCIRCETPLPENTDLAFDLAAGGMTCPPCAGPLGEFGHLLTTLEHLFIRNSSHLRLSTWPVIQFPENLTTKLHHIVTRFASYHTGLRLPL